MKRLTDKIFRGVLAAVALLAFAEAVTAQEMFSVNIWSTGRPGSRGGIWGDEGSDDPTDPDRDPDIDTVWLDPDQEAGLWKTTDWDNYQQTPFTTSTAPMEITGSQGSVATIEVVQMRNSGTYLWNQVRDDSDAVSVPNATLLGSLIRGTEFDDANGGGAPFPARIVEVEVTHLPFECYDVVVYLGTELNRGPDGTIRVNEEIPADPTDPSGLEFNVVDGEPDGSLIEIVDPGDTGNYVFYEELTGETLKIQVWGHFFNHIGIAGLQIRDADSGGEVGPRFARGDADSNGSIELTDGVRILNFLFLGREPPSCNDAADADDNGRLELTDAVAIFSWLFLGEDPPRSPTPSSPMYVATDCGRDPTDDDGLDCATEAATCSP